MTKNQDTPASTAAQGLPEAWTPVAGGTAIHKRFEFETYAQTSAFLEALANLSEETGIHPDLSFAKTHANVTVPSGSGDGGEDAAEAQRAFATRAEALFGEFGP